MWRYSRVVSLSCCLLTGKPAGRHHNIKMPSIKITTKLSKNNRCPKNSISPVVEDGSAWFYQDKPPPTMNSWEPTNLPASYYSSTATCTINPRIYSCSLVKKGLAEGIRYQKPKATSMLNSNVASREVYSYRKTAQETKAKFSDFSKYCLARTYVGCVHLFDRWVLCRSAIRLK